MLLVDEESLESLDAQELDADRYTWNRCSSRPTTTAELIAEPPPFGQWYRISGVENAPATVAAPRGVGRDAPNSTSCTSRTTPTAVAARRIRRWPREVAAEGWGANPWRAHPWRANPWRANSWSANPWRAHPEELNVVATGRPPTSSVMPAPFRTLPQRPAHPSNAVVIGVLDSGLAGGADNADGYRPALLGMDPASMQRISGESDVPSQSMGTQPADNYLDPVAGHGTFIAGIIEQLTPGCDDPACGASSSPRVTSARSTLAFQLWSLMGPSSPRSSTSRSAGPGGACCSSC